MPKRKVYTKAFKAKVALEAVRSEKSVAELSGQHGVHAKVIHEWKKILENGAGDLFTRKNARKEKDAAAETKELHAKIGQLTVENDFLARGLKSVRKK